MSEKKITRNKKLRNAITVPDELDRMPLLLYFFEEPRLPYTHDPSVEPGLVWYFAVPVIYDSDRKGDDHSRVKQKRDKLFERIEKVVQHARVPDSNDLIYKKMTIIYSPPCIDNNQQHLFIEQHPLNMTDDREFYPFKALVMAAEFYGQKGFHIHKGELLDDTPDATTSMAYRRRAHLTQSYALN